MQIFMLILFFLSGFASLVYEVLWARLFGLLLGNTTLAISCVLAAFFTGMALGGRFFGRRAVLHARPLRLFAVMEAALCASALFILLLRTPVEALFTALHPALLPHPLPYALLRFLVAFLTMLPATFFMGGTLPVMSRAYLRREGSGAGALGALYGVNTLGGMAGCLAAAFFFLRYLGFTLAFAVAIAIDLAIAAAAWALARRRRPALAGAAHPAVPAFSAAEKTILAALALSGCIAMSYEVLWTRILVFALTSATYSFSIILAAFLFSIALGGLAGGRWAERSSSPRRLLGLLEIGAGLSAVAALLLLLQMPHLQKLLFTPSPTTTWWAWNGIRFLQAFLVTSLAAFLLGATFPVAFRALDRAGEHRSAAIGELYFYNTLGGVAGSLLTGLVLIAWLGAAAALLLMILLNLALGFWLWRGATLRRGLVGAAAALLLALVLIRLTPATLLARIYSIAEEEYPLVALREGIEGTVTVHRQPASDGGERRIDVDGLNVAGSSRMLRTLQLLQGHLPLLVHPNPQRALQIGFGTGQTSQAALSHPLAAFQLVEISPDVLRLSAELFKDLNQGVMRDPRFQPLLMDGKNQLRYTRERYDIIMNDANYAVATASASLFTRDHFENGRSKLQPGGLFSTWMTTDLDPEDFRIVLRTFQSVFPHAVLWMAPNCINKQVVLMGSTSPLHFDWANWQARWPQAAAALEGVDITSPYDLFACLLLDEQGMARLCKEAAVNSDDRPVLEFSTRDIRARDLCAFQNLSAMLAEPPDWRQYLAAAPGRPAPSPEEMARLERYGRASRQLFQGMLLFYQGQNKRALATMLNSSRLIPESRLASGFYAETDRQTLRLFQAMNREPAVPGPRLTLARQYIGLERYSEASALLRPLLRQEPPDPAAAYETARVLLAQGKSDSARLWIDHSLRQRPRMAGSWFLSGRIAESAGDPQRALQAYRTALNLDPGMHEAHARMGHVLLQQGDYAPARENLLASLRNAPAQPAVAAEMGDLCLFQQNPEQAVAWYRRALRLGSSEVHTWHNLGNGLAMLGQFAEAVPAYRAALALAPDRAELHYNLANALIRLGEDQEALQLLQRAIDLDPGQADYYNNLAMLYDKMGARTRALQVLEAGLRRHPGAELMIRNLQTLRAKNNGRQP